MSEVCSSGGSQRGSDTSPTPDALVANSNMAPRETRILVGLILVHSLRIYVPSM